MIQTPAMRGADAPPNSASVRVERQDGGVAVLRLVPVHRKIAVLDLPLMRELSNALEELERDVGLKAVVVTGERPLCFAAGADLDALAAIDSAGRGEELSRLGQGIFQRLAALSQRTDHPVRTVAAVGGPVPGGAYELCLACRWIVAADHPSTKIGLPEVNLGIVPGWGGTQLLPRRIGVPRALEAILSGKLYTARRAHKLGMVDRVTHPEYLLRIALEIARGKRAAPVHERGVWTYAIDRNPFALRSIARKAAEDVRARTRGHYPAPIEALKLVVAAPRTELAKGLADEAAALGALAASPVCKNLVSVFRMAEDKKRFSDESGAPVREVRRAGVLGAGVMGATIASLMAEKGVGTRLRDVALDILDRAVLAHRERIGRELARHRTEPHQATAAIDRLETTLELSGFQRCELVLEAVAENLEIKRAVLRDLVPMMAPDAIVATNTSSLSLAAIAEAVPNPDRVVGMHFFNPVIRMPLVEVVRGEHTSDETVATTAVLAIALGKTPIVVRDVAGFLVNRLLGPYLDEAARLFEAGADPRRLERACLEFGMPMGPLALLDEIGFDIAAHAAASLYQAYGERMSSSGLLDRMRQAGRLGKKNGKGFYEHKADTEASGAPTRVLAPDLQPFISRDLARGQDFSEQVILDSLILAMVNEAARCLEEGVVASASDLDLATVLGMGFPPFRGGLLRYADTVGAKDIVIRLRRIAGSPDVLRRPGGAARFTPTLSLIELAERGGRFHPALGVTSPPAKSSAPA